MGFLHVCRREHLTDTFIVTLTEGDIMADSDNDLTTDQVIHILIRSQRQEGYTQQEAAEIVDTWFTNYRQDVLNEVEDFLEDAFIAELAEERLDSPTVSDDTETSNLLLSVTLDGFDEKDVFTEHADENNEVSSTVFIRHLTEHFSITHEGARDAILELVSRHRLILTSAYKLRLPNT